MGGHSRVRTLSPQGETVRARPRGRPARNRGLARLRGVGLSAQGPSGPSVSRTTPLPDVWLSDPQVHTSLIFSRAGYIGGLVRVPGWAGICTPDSTIGGVDYASINGNHH